jgi:hypothetical protein
MNSELKKKVPGHIYRSNWYDRPVWSKQRPCRRKFLLKSGCYEEYIAWDLNFMSISQYDMKSET